MGPNMIQAKGNVHSTVPLALLLLLVALLQGSTGKTLKYKVYEEQRVGTVIARLKDDVAGVLSKLPNSLSFRFRAMQRGSTQLLSVREEDGEISIGTKIDREKLCEKNLNCSIEFDVVTLPTEYLQLFHVEVEVLDINDNSPHFSRAIVPIEISESASVGTRIPLDGAVDADVGENSLHTYSLTPNNFFKIDVRTRTDGAKYAELVVMRELDREVQSSYQLQLTASDNGVPPKSGSTLLKISISDSNDNSPAFDEQAYVINLLENSPLGTLIIDLNATDPDEGTNGKIVYSFSSHVSPKILETFKINPENGHITLIKKVDYETTASYELDVQAQDLGPNSIPGLCKIVVKVVDVNDNKPEININLMSPGKEEVAYISEGAPVDTFIALVRVDDMDAGLNGEVVCRLHGHGHFRLQKTHEKNYMILTNVSLDREKRSEYSLTVMAEDKGSPSLSTIKHFTVQVLDENDNPPHFEKSRYEVFKSENNSPGAYLMTVVASDPDLGTNGQVTYTIIDAVIQASPITTYVTIDPSNGAIYALRSFDHEDVSRVAFTVQARDSGNPALSTNTTVLLTVMDENDNPPIIHSPSLRNHTAELPVWKYASPGQLISTLKITDRDSGANGEQVSQLLSMLHQGQYQPRPSFRGNKYTRSYRYALNEMDKFSLKDSGRGDSEAGDSDYEPGRESPIDRLLGEAFTELYSPDGQHCSHAAMKLCTEECRVLGHSDQCWMPPLGCPASSSADYRSNLYIPGEEAHQATDITQEQVPQPCTDTCTARNQSFSTFGKDLGGEDGAEEDGLEGGSKSTDEDLCGTTSLLSEMSSVFQRLLPQGLDSYVQVNENQKGTSLSGVGVPMTGSLDRRRGHLPGKPSPSVYQQGVAAWAANTHFQNPGSSIGPSGQHQGGSYHTLKANTKLSCQSSNNKGSQAPKNSPQNSGHSPKPTSNPLLTGLVSPTLVQTSLTQPPVQAMLNGPSSKWLPAMEEIPENYEEDDFDSVLSHLQGKRSDSRHELVDASELVAEINKLLQDVRQT
ncbi:protocadherin-18b isoform X4 [Poeciliopsis prolifica]|uniref:protocadherin-18b isoform X4 n=1 Tax=Poeciliopsis prolifica TaxID=188132 RepID=UPI002414200D|nr:protocadherin-18b isoform X4 [Poeciliopsis prolifica]